MSDIRWGVMGVAKIAREWLMPAIHKSATGRLTAVASLSGATVQGYGDLTYHSSYEALLADPDVDAIYIPLPNHMHVEWTLKAIAAGKHVLCEKPIALEAAQIDALIAARDAQDVVVAEAFMVLHHPQWHRAKALLDSGVIGDLVHVQGAFTFYNDDTDNIRNRCDAGGGALRDIGVYPSIVTRFVTGAEPVSATAQIDWQNGIDATVRTQLNFDGFGCDFYVSMRMANRQFMAFHGTKGVIEVAAPFNAGTFGDEVVTLRVGDTLTHERFPGADQYCAQIEAFNAAVRGDAVFPVSLENSRDNQVMIDMIYAADGGAS